MFKTIFQGITKFGGQKERVHFSPRGYGPGKAQS